MGRRLWCRKCGQGVVTVGGEIPPVCHACQVPAQWSTLQPAVQTTPSGLILTKDDRELLRKYRIACD